MSLGSVCIAIGCFGLIRSLGSVGVYITAGVAVIKLLMCVV